MDMMITLSKVLPLLVYPLNLALLLLLIGTILLWRGRGRIGGAFVTFALIVLLAASMPPVAAALGKSLERQYLPLSVQNAPSTDAILVLGGGIDIKLPPRTDAELGEPADRVLYAARLYRAGKAPVVVVTGGNVFAHDIESESEFAKRLLEEWGVKPDAIVVEGSSRNTYQNAVETAKIARRIGFERALLVTSAIHMPRAMATFRAAGINVVAAPTDFQVVQSRRPVILDWLPSAQALALTTRATKEYLGIMVYRWRGWLGD